MSTARKRCSLFLLACSLLWSLASCAATGEPFHRGEAVPGKASLYIYRAQKALRLFAWDVDLDGRKLTKLRAGDYFYTTVSPRHHTLLVWVEEVVSPVVLQFSPDPDATYYFRLHQETEWFVVYSKSTWILQRVPEAQALSELTDLTLSRGIDRR